MKDYFEEHGLTALACIGSIIGLYLAFKFIAPDSQLAYIVDKFLETLMGV